MRQFGRQYQLVIGSSSDGFTFNNLRIAYQITKTIDKCPNPARIRIYNLTREHMGAVLSKKYTTVALSAGYDALRLIYAGDITKSNVMREGMDFVLEIECGDGTSAYTSARINMTLPAGTTDAQAAIAIAGTMPVPRGTMAVQRTAPSTRARVYSGSTRDALTNLARANNADWSIQDGQILMLPSNAALAGTGPLISESTGMVDMPKQSDNGLVVKCLINPALQIGGVIRVQSILPHYSGDFKIVTVEHAGDFRQGQWLSTITCVGGVFQKIAKKSKKAASGYLGGAGGDESIDEGTLFGPHMGPRVWTVEELAGLAA